MRELAGGRRQQLGALQRVLLADLVGHFRSWYHHARPKVDICSIVHDRKWTSAPPCTTESGHLPCSCSHWLQLQVAMLALGILSPGFGP